MKKNSIVRDLIATAIAILLAIGIAYLPGCTKNDVTGPDNTSVATTDAAETIASAIGDENGGVYDQVADIVSVSTAQSTDGLLNSDPNNPTLIKSRTYDEITKKWTIIIERTRSRLNGLYYSHIVREYELQYLNKNNQLIHLQ